MIVCGNECTWLWEDVVRDQQCVRAHKVSKKVYASCVYTTDVQNHRKKKKNDKNRISGLNDDTSVTHVRNEYVRIMQSSCLGSFVMIGWSNDWSHWTNIVLEKDNNFEENGSCVRGRSWPNEYDLGDTVVQEIDEVFWLFKSILYCWQWFHSVMWLDTKWSWWVASNSAWWVSRRPQILKWTSIYRRMGTRRWRRSLSVFYF